MVIYYLVVRYHFQFRSAVVRRDQRSSHEFNKPLDCGSAVVVEFGSAVVVEVVVGVEVDACVDASLAGVG